MNDALKHLIMRRYILLYFTLMLLHPLVTSAKTYYVSNSGDDMNSGISMDSSFATLQKAADIVIAGDSVIVLPGTYNGFDLRNKNGTDLAPIVFFADISTVINNNGPIREDGINIENADHIIIDGFDVIGMVNGGNGIRVVLSDHCVVRNCYCDQNDERGIFTGFTDDILIENNICTNSVDEHGIYVSNSSDRPIIRYNECYGNNNIGIHMNGDLSAGGDGIISDAQIYGNIIHDNNLAAGINMDGCENPVVYNNLIYNNHFAQGIALFQGDGAIPTRGAKIYNNTIIVPDDGRWGILMTSGSNVNTVIYNNIIINDHPWRGCITAESTSQLTSDYNILQDKMSNSGDGSAIPLSTWQGLGLDQNSLIADPKEEIFVDTLSSDYHLTSGSQAINTGSNAVFTIVSNDLDLNYRPYGTGYDIGCYEFVENITDIDLLVLENEITLFPNPSSGLFRIKGDLNEYSIRILDVTGQVYLNLDDVENALIIDISSLPVGMYFIQVYKGESNAPLSFQKIIKM